MLSNSGKQTGKNSSDNVFGTTLVGPGEAALVKVYLADQDYAANSRRVVVLDLRKFAGWFAQANAEPFRLARVTTRDITDFKNWLRRDRGQAVLTVNRCLVTLRRYFAWAVEKGHVPSNPAKSVKELRRQQLPPRAWNVRTFVGCCGRSNSDKTCGPTLSSTSLYTGGRISDLVALELRTS